MHTKALLKFEIKYSYVVLMDFLTSQYPFDKDAARLLGPGSPVALASGFIGCQCCSKGCTMRFPPIRETTSLPLYLHRQSYNVRGE